MVDFASNAIEEPLDEPKLLEHVPQPPDNL
jgi:hypothetical protein